MKNSKDRLHYFINFILPDIILGILCLGFLIGSSDSEAMICIFIFPYMVLYAAAFAAVVPFCEGMGFRHYFSAPEYFYPLNRHAAIQLIVSAAAAVTITIFCFVDMTNWQRYIFPMIFAVSNVTAALMLKRNVKNLQTEIFDKVKLNDKS